jgi:hypothetical protein
MVQVRCTPLVPFECELFLFENCILLLSIIYMRILKWVFLYRESGRICRSGPAVIAALERQILPVRNGELAET